MLKIQTLSTAIALFSFFVTYSQSYTLVTATANYEPLVNATTIDEVAPDTFKGTPIYNSIPIGFDFELEDKIFNSVQLTEDGFAVFKTLDTAWFWISIYDCNLTNFKNDPHLSPIRYTTTGTLGNRIFKCEYKSAGFEEDMNLDNFVNFQLWIYEFCNNFEFRIGPNFISSDVFWNSASAPFIGYGRYLPNRRNNYLTGNPISPVLKTGITDPTTSGFMNAVPEEAMVYTFLNCPVGRDELTDETAHRVYPNPLVNRATIQLDRYYAHGTVEVIDYNGRIVLTKAYSNAQSLELNLEQLPSGLYMVNVQTPGSVQQLRMVKK